jgi:hypothetical protein
MLCTCYMEDFDSTGVDCLWCRLLELDTLASNLRTASALCAAFYLGAAYRSGAINWKSGCGEPMPVPRNAPGKQ